MKTSNPVVTDKGELFAFVLDENVLALGKYQNGKQKNCSSFLFLSFIFSYRKVIGTCARYWRKK